MTDKKIKVSHYLEAGQEPQQIEIENGGADGYKGKWWETFPPSKDYGTINPHFETQSGDLDRKSDASGITWFDHHSQAYNDDKSNRKHPQRKYEDD